LLAAVAVELLDRLFLDAVGIRLVAVEELAGLGGVDEGPGGGFVAGVDVAGGPEVVGLLVEALALLVGEVAEGLVGGDADFGREFAELGLEGGVVVGGEALEVGWGVVLR
jgi:hypothetical protein